MNKSKNKSPKTRGISRPRASFQDRIDDIHAKAAILFAQNGYPYTTMDQIAKVANLKKGGLYHYIKNKETLLFTILDQTLNTFLERAEKLDLEGLDPKQKLEHFIYEYTRTLVRHHNEVRLMVLAARYLQPKMLDVITKKRKAYENLFYSIIADGLSKRVFTEYISKETMGSMILGAIFNYYLWQPAELGHDIEKKTRGFYQFFLNALLVR